MDTEKYFKEMAAAKGKDYPVFPMAKGVPYQVSDGKDVVVLTIDGNQYQLTVDSARYTARYLRAEANRVETVVLTKENVHFNLTNLGARDLCLALRQSANRVEKQMRLR